jgi:YVTN family beta-propeller protein
MMAEYSDSFPKLLAGALLIAMTLLGASPAAAQSHFPIGSGFSAPNGVAIDAGGNVFVADTDNAQLKEILAPDYAATRTLPIARGTFSEPGSIAIDAQGNLFVGDINTGVVKEVLADSSYATVITISSNFTIPTGIAVDAEGNVFVADDGTNQLYELVGADHYSTMITLSLSFSELGGVAVDAQGNLFTADENNGIQESPAASGYTTLIDLASGNQNIVQTFAIALDGKGNLFYTDLTLGAAFEIPIASGYQTVIPRLGSLSEPTGIAADSRGNLFIADPNNGSGTIDELAAATATGVTSSLSPSTLGASVTLTATVTPSAGTPTGTVTFLDGLAPLGTVPLTSGTAALATTSLPVGSHLISAAYGGDDNYAPSTSAAVTQVVNPATTSTTLTSSANPSLPGQSVTFTASVPAIGGTVTFKDGSTTLETVGLVSGAASYTSATLTNGNHPITASYSGNTDFAASDSATLTESVGLVASTTSLISSADPSAANQPVTFTAFVGSADGVPTGTVTFLDGSTPLGAGTLSNGIASFSTAALTATSHSITASYGGNTSFAVSTSTALTQTVTPAATAATQTTLTSSADPSSAGQTVTFTALVSGQGGPPTGTVTFSDAGTTLGSAPLSSALAHFATASLAPGPHAISAHYAGDGSFAASTSAALTQIVAPSSVAGQVYGYQNTLGTTGVAGTDPAHFDKPAPGAVDPARGHLFVADTGNDRVQVIDTGSLAVVATIGVAGVGGADNAHLDQPSGVGFDAATNHLFVADTGNQRVQVFDAASLAYVATLGTAGTAGNDDAHFDQPASAATDPLAHRLYVADSGNQRVQIFDAASLAYVATLGTTGSAGSDNAHFSALSDAELDPSTGQILVADTGNQRVQLFDAESLAYAGTLGITGVPGADNVHFAAPRTATFDPTTNLVLVADAGSNQRVQVFDAMTYAYVLTLGTAGSGGPGQAQFSGPQGIAVDPAKSRLFVGDAQNDRVQVFAIAPVTTMASVLPGSRAVQLGQAATIFASVLNAGATALDGCAIALPATSPQGLSLSYQTTDPATNTLTGTPDTPATIPGGDGVQSFLVTLQGTTALSALALPLDFDCTGAAPAAIVPGVDTVDLILSASPVADIIALAATPSSNGILGVPASGSAAFAVASTNVGITAPLIASVDTGATTLPISATLCQSNTSTGQCLSTPAASVPLSFAAGAAPTFSVFVQASGPVALSPATARVFVRFKDSSGGLHGSTSVAVETE